MCLSGCARTSHTDGVCFLCSAEWANSKWVRRESNMNLMCCVCVLVRPKLCGQRKIKQVTAVTYKCMQSVVSRREGARARALVHTMLSWPARCLVVGGRHRRHGCLFFSSTTSSVQSEKWWVRRYEKFTFYCSREFLTARLTSGGKRQTVLCRVVSVKNYFQPFKRSF